MNIERRTLIRLLLWFVLPAWPVALAPAGDGYTVFDQGQYHLGTPGFPEWDDFRGKIPHGRSLEIRFQSRTNQTEAALFLRQRDVKFTWTVQLNGRKLGNLHPMEASLVQAFEVPAGTLRDGDNELRIQPPAATDDIVVGEFALDWRPWREALRQTVLDVTVTEAPGGRPVPCRLTVVDQEGALAALVAEPAPDPGGAAEASATVAARPGVVYARTGRARIGLLPGEYAVYASRGLEYGVSTQAVSVAAGSTGTIHLAIPREVPTPNWVACDSHIHTLTHSGHGDATLDERMLTIAGEGIELAIATDHNHHTDYYDAARRLGVADRFTSVIGNEVTTKAGHFNAFPIRAGSPVADFNTTDWALLMQSIRATPGVRVITLNHPRDLHSNFIPLGQTNFNPVTGENLRGSEYSFDALEVVTSAALQSDLMRLFHDWFALLNYGYRIAAVGSSDTHDVSRFILGQGRTYVAADDSDPARLNLEEIWESYRNGRLLVSMGLLVEMTVNDRFAVGDLAPARPGEDRVTVTVSGPSWTTADRIELYANGILLRTETLASTTQVVKARRTWTLPRFPHDVHLVAIASGPGVTAPFWEIPRPYQPSSRAHVPRVIAATNPVWLDADGDGKFSAARQYARNLVARHGAGPATLLPALASYDEAVAAQAAALCHAAGRDVRGREFASALQRAPAAVQRGFAAFIATLGK